MIVSAFFVEVNYDTFYFNNTGIFVGNRFLANEIDFSLYGFKLDPDLSYCTYIVTVHTSKVNADTIFVWTFTDIV